MIDTGSKVMMIEKDLYDKIESPKLQCNNESFMGISGEKVTPIGYFATEFLLTILIYKQMCMFSKICVMTLTLDWMCSISWVLLFQIIAF